MNIRSPKHTIALYKFEIIEEMHELGRDDSGRLVDVIFDLIMDNYML